MNKNFILLASPLFAAMMLLSCSDDKKDPPEDPTLSLSPTTETIGFSWQATEIYTFEVKTNQSSWTAEPNQSWCKVSPDYEKNTFTVTALANDSQTALPEATITVKAGEATPVTIKATIGTVGYSVCVIGRVYYESGSRWCYWKDGVRTDMNDEDVWHATASNGSVYMLGGYADSEGERLHCYWKDGVRIGLEDIDPRDIDIHRIAASNGSVHIIGKEYTDMGTIPFHWKDGVRNNLSLPDNTEGEVRSIVVSGGSVYVGGFYEKEDFGKVACYWKDGVRTDLEFDERAAENVLIAVEAGSVYVTGDYHLSDQKTLPYLWKDGVRTTCQDPGTGQWTYPLSIAVENGTAHILGYNWGSGILLYWKDGILIELDYGENFENWYSDNSIAAVGGSVYMTGAFWDVDSNISTACYWKDGVRVDLDTPEGDESDGFFIVVNKE